MAQDVLDNHVQFIGPQGRGGAATEPGVGVLGQLPALRPGQPLYDASLVQAAWPVAVPQPQQQMDPATSQPSDSQSSMVIPYDLLNPPDIALFITFY